MNKAYRLIWSQVKDAWVIVAEIVKGNGGPPPLTMAVMIAATMALLAGEADALPTGQQVVNGSAVFSTTGNTLTIKNSPNAIINWQGFSIAANETTRFNQDSALSSVLNRVTGLDPSQILGSLQSNGKVFLINPNGIIFGQGSRIDVAGLVASSLGISNQDFLAGKYNFTTGGTVGAVKNQGEITTTAGGLVWLISPNVENSGIITSPNGSVMLAAGQSVNMVDPQRPEIAVVVSAPTDQAVNIGTVLAQGGSTGIFGSLVKQQGVINADSAVAGPGGRIFLKSTMNTTLGVGSVTSANAGDNGDGGRVVVLSDGETKIAGTLSAKGGNLGGDGGFIETSGSTISFAGASVSASAKKGRAGLWLIDPTDLEINDVGACNISTTLSNGTDVTATTLTCSSAFGVCSGTTGNINVSSNITWGTSNHLTLLADNNITINAGIFGTSGTLTLDAPGLITQPSALNTLPITVANLELLRGNFILDNGDNAIGTLAAGNNLNTVGNVTLYTNNMPLTVGSVGSSVGINSSGTVTLKVNALNIDENINAFSSVILGADSMTLTGGITAPNVSLGTFTSGYGIDIISGAKSEPPSTLALEINSADLLKVSASESLEIGGYGNTGTINIETPIKLSGNADPKNLYLSASTAINQNADLQAANDITITTAAYTQGTGNVVTSTGAGGTISLVVNSMTLDGGIIAPNVSLGTYSVTDISIFSGTKTESSTALEINSADFSTISASNSLEIGGYSNVGAITINTPIKLSGNTDPINLYLNAGTAINQNADLQATKDITIKTPSLTQDDSSPTIVAGTGGTVSLNVDSLTLTGGITAPTVALAQYTPGWAINIGAYADNSLMITDTALSAINATENLRFGNSNTGNIFINTPINMAGRNLTIESYGSVTQMDYFQNNLITASGLELRGAASFSLMNSAYGGNAIDTIAGTANYLDVKNNKTLTVGIVNDSTGLTGAYDINLTATGAAGSGTNGIVVNSPLKSTAGIITLTGTGAAGTNAAGGVGVNINGNVTADNGSISISGYGGTGDSGYGGGVGVNINGNVTANSIDSYIYSNAVGNINIHGEGGAGGAGSDGGHGVLINGNIKTVSTAIADVYYYSNVGNIDITGIGGTGGSNIDSTGGGAGVVISGGSNVTTQGEYNYVDSSSAVGRVSINGTGGTGGAGTSSDPTVTAQGGSGGRGIDVSGSVTTSNTLNYSDSSTVGDITMTGTGGAGGAATGADGTVGNINAGNAIGGSGKEGIVVGHGVNISSSGAIGTISLTGTSGIGGTATAGSTAYSGNVPTPTDGAGATALNLDADSALSATNVSLTASSMNIGSITADQTVTLDSKNADIDLGTKTAGTLGLTATELGAVTANNLVIKSSGSLAVSAPITIDSAKVNAFTLDVAGATTQASNAPVTAANLELLSGDFTLDNADNAVGTLAAGNAYGPTVGTITIVNSQGLNIGSVGSSSGINSIGTVSLTAPGTTNQSAPITAPYLELKGGAFNLADPYNAIGTLAGNVTSVNLINNQTLTVGTVNTVGLTASGDISLTATAQFGDGIIVNSLLASTAGNISLTGTAASNGGAGIYVNGSIETGGGNVTLTGYGGGGGFGDDHGVYLDSATITTGGGKIDVTGIAGGEGNGIYAGYSTLDTRNGSSKGGNVTLTGTGGNFNNFNAYAGVFLEYSGITTGGGDIKITGTGGGDGYGNKNYGIYTYNANLDTRQGYYDIDANFVYTGAGGNVTLSGIGGRGYDYNHGVFLDGDGYYGDYTTVNTGGGALNITGTGGGNDYDNYGIYINSATLDTSHPVGVTTGGTVTLTGTGGNGYASNYGVYLGAEGSIISGGGGINIIGTGRGSAYDNYGIYVSSMSDSTYLNSGSGSTTLTGIGANGYEGIYFDAGIQIGSSGSTGNVTLETDSFYSYGYNDIYGGTLTLKPLNDATTIGIGGGSGTLDLSSLFYNSNIYTNNVVIGKTTGTGLISVGYDGLYVDGNLTLQNPGVGSRGMALGGDIVTYGNSLTLNTVGTVTQDSGTGVYSGNLNLLGAGAYYLLTGDNQVGTLSGNTTGVAFRQAVSEGTNSDVTIGGLTVSEFAVVDSPGANVLTPANITGPLQLINGMAANNANNVTYWTNDSGDYNWNTAANWSGGIVPTGPETVRIATTDTGTISLGSAAGTVGSLLSTADLQINTGGTLTLGGDARFLRSATMNGGILAISNGTTATINTLNLDSGSVTGPGSLSVTRDYNRISGTLGAGIYDLLLTGQDGLTIDTPLSVVRNLTLYAQGIDADLTTHSTLTRTGSSGTFGLKADGSVILGTGTAISSDTGTLNVNLTSNAADFGTGNIQMNPGSSIVSNGGNVTLAGGINGADRAVGTGWNQVGILLDGATIDAGGGTISLKGSGAAGEYNADGIYVTNSSRIKTSGSGIITLDGIGGDGYDENNGVRLGTDSSILSENGAITIAGQGSGIGNDNYGIYMHNGATVAATGTGTITLTGTGSETGSGSNRGIRMSASGGATSISTASGNIFMYGYGGADGDGIQIVDGSLVQSGSGKITIDGTGCSFGSASGYCYGTWIGDFGTQVRSRGDISITGRSLATDGDNYGLLIDNRAEVRTYGSGNIELTGEGGYGYGWNYGVHLDYSTVATSGGTINIAGTGHGYDYGNYGIYTDAAILESRGGKVTLTGRGSLDGYDNNYGVRLDYDTRITTAGGALDITGYGGGSGSNNHGIYADGSTTLDTRSRTGAVGGTVTLTGWGSIAGTYNNAGVYMEGGYNNEGTTIITGGGDINITGHGGGSGYDNHGIYLDGAMLDSGTVDGSSVGGKLTLAGYASADGSYGNKGIYLNGGEFYNYNTSTYEKYTTTIKTGGGDIEITGYGGGSPWDSGNDGIYTYSTILDSSRLGRTAGGNVTLTGTGGDGDGSSNGVYLGGEGYSNAYTTIITGGGNMTVTGTAVGSGDGISTYYANIDTARSDGSGGGNVTLNGGRAVDSNSYGNGVYLDETNITTGGGDLSITGGGGYTGGEGLWTSYTTLDSSRSDGLVGGKVTLVGTGGSSYGFNYGIHLADTDIYTGGGELSITGNGGGSDGNNNYGIYADYTTLDTSRPGGTGGKVTLTGTGGNGYYENQGVYLGNADIITGGGELNVTGTAAGTDSSNYGIHTYYASLDSGSGEMTLTGVGAADSGGSEGLYFDTGTVIGGGQSIWNGEGYDWVPNQTGNINLIAGGSGASSIAIVDTGYWSAFPIIGSTGTLTLRPFDDAGTVTIGGSGTAGGLNLNSSALSAVTMDSGSGRLGFNNDGFKNVVIGSVGGTGKITVGNSGWYVSGANLTLQNAGAGIAIDGVLETVGNLTLNTTGTVTQAAPIYADGLELLGSGANYQLSNPGNGISTLAGNTGNVSFSSNSNFNVGTVNRTIGLTASDNVTFYSTGMVTQSDSIIANGLELLGGNGTDYQLTDAGNRISILAGNVGCPGCSTGSISFTNSGGFEIGNVNTTGGLTADSVTLDTSGTVTQTSPINVSSLSLQGTGATYLLGDAGNKVEILEGDTASVYLKDSIGLSIGTNSLYAANDVTLDLGSNYLTEESGSVYAGGLKTVIDGESYTQTCAAGTICWTGGIDNSWSESGNWIDDIGNNVVPLADANVRIGSVQFDGIKVKTVTAITTPASTQSFGSLIANNEEIIIPGSAVLGVTANSAFNRTLTLSGGTLDIGSTSTRVNTLALNSGSISGADGSLDVTHDFSGNLAGLAKDFANLSLTKQATLTVNTDLAATNGVSLSSVTGDINFTHNNTSPGVSASWVTLRAAGAVTNNSSGTNVVSSYLSIKAGNGIGTTDNPLKTEVSYLNVWNTTSGDIAITNSGNPLYIEDFDLGNGYGIFNNTPGGKVKISNDDSIYLTGYNYNAGVYADSDVSLTATGAISDIVTGGDQDAIQSGGGNIRLDAGHDVLLGVTDGEISSYGDVYTIKNGTIDINAGNDVIVDFNTYVQTDAGNLTITAQRDVSVFNDSMVQAGTDTALASGAVNVIARTGMISVAAPVNWDNGIFTDGSAIILTADNMDLQGPVNSAFGGRSAATVTLQPYTPSTRIEIGANATDDPLGTPKTLGLDDFELGNITASHLIIGSATGTGLISDVIEGGTSVLNDLTLRNPGTGSEGMSFSSGLSINGNLTLHTTGTMTQTGAITANGLELLGVGGAYTLTASGNHIGTVAGNTGSVDFMSSDLYDITVGKVNNTVGLTITGNGTLYSDRDIIVANDIRKAGTADATVSLKADRAVVVEPDKVIGLADGASGMFNVVLNADASASGSGNILLNAGSRIRTNGGNLVMGGGICDTSGCDGAAFGYGYSDGQKEGIFLGDPNWLSKSLVQLDTSAAGTGGNIWMTSQGYGSTGNAYGIFSRNAAISAGGGSVTLAGTGGNSDSYDNNYGVYLDYNTSVSTGGGALDITGTGSGSSYNGDGIYTYNTNLDTSNPVITTAGGSVTLTGYGDTGGSYHNYGAYLENTRITTGGGTLDITGTGGGISSGSNNYGIYTYYSSLDTGRHDGSAGGIVTLAGNGGNGSANNKGVWLEETRVATGGGTLDITGNGGLLSDSGNYGLQLSYNVLLNTRALDNGDSGGNVTLTGTGNSALGSSYNYGVYLNNQVRITTGGGTIDITGNGNGSVSDNHGIYVDGAILDSRSLGNTTGGTVTLIGTGGSGSGDGNYVFVGNNRGVYLNGSNYDTRIVSGGGDISILGGSGAGSSNYGIYTQYATLDARDGVNGGHVNLTGTGGSGSDGNVGVSMDNSTILTTGSGTLNINGTGGGTGLGNYGIYTSNTNLDSGTGTMTLTGIGTGGAEGLYFDYGTVIGGHYDINNNLTAPQVGNINLVADSDGVDSIFAYLNDGNNNPVIQGTGTLTLRPLNDATTIGIAGGSGDFNLSTSDLAAIQPGFSNIVIGNTTGSGLILAGSLSGTWYVPSNANLTLQNPLYSGGDGVIIDGGINTYGNLTVTSGGNITETAYGGLYVAGTSSFTAAAGSGAITLTGANDFTGTVSLAGGAVQVTDTSALILGTVNASNLNVITTGAITQNPGDLLTVTGDSSFNAGSAAITLTEATNDFHGAVSLTGGVAQITNAGALKLGTLNTGDLTATANANLVSTGTLDLGTGTVNGTLTAVSNDGDITQTVGGLTVTGTSDINAGTGAINLTDNSNDFQGVVTLTGAATQITDVNDLTLGAVTTGDLTVTAGGALNLGTGTIEGALDVTASGAVSQTGALTVTGTTAIDAGILNDITLDVAENKFDGAVTIIGAKNVTLYDADSLDVSGAIDGNLTTVAETTTNIGATTVGNDLSVTAKGDITNNGALSVLGNSTFTTVGGKNISVNSSGTDFGGTVSFVASSGKLQDITLTSASDLKLQSFDISGNLTASAVGDITQSGSITAGATTLTGASITLNSANVLGTVTVNAGIGDVSITENDSITIAGITHTGNLALTSTSGSISQSGAISGTSLTASAATGISLNGTNNVALASLSNSSSGDVSFNGPITGDLAVGGSNGASGGGFSVVKPGAGTQVVVGATGISTNNGPISLTADNLVFSGLIASGTGDVTLKPLTAGTTMGVLDGSKAFNISDTMLGQITTSGTVVIGDVAAGALTAAVNGAIDRPTLNLTLLSGSDINYDNGISANNLTLNAGGSIIGNSGLGGTLTAAGKLSLVAGIDIITSSDVIGTGGVLLNSGASGMLDTSAGIISNNGSAADVVIASNNYNVGDIDAGTASLTLTTSSPGETLNLGANSIISVISGGSLTFGDPLHTGDIVVAGAMVLDKPALFINGGGNILVNNLITSTTSPVTIDTHGINPATGIAATTGAITGSANITAPSLTLLASEGINLTGNNAVGAVALTNTGSGDVAFSGTSATGMTVSGSNAANFSVTNTTGSLNVGTINAGGGVTLTSSGSINGSGSGAAITAGSANLISTTGIGTPTTPFLTAVGTLAGASGGNGSVNIENQGALTVTGQIESTGSTVSIVTHSPLTINANVLAYGDVSLFAGASGLATDNLAIGSGINITSQVGNVLLKAGEVVSVGGLPLASTENLIGSSNYNLYASMGKVIVRDHLNTPPATPLPALNSQNVLLLSEVSSAVNGWLGVIENEATDLTDEDEDENMTVEGESHGTEFRALPYCN